MILSLKLDSDLAPIWYSGLWTTSTWQSLTIILAVTSTDLPVYLTWTTATVMTSAGPWTGWQHAKALAQALQQVLFQCIFMSHTTVTVTPFKFWASGVDREVPASLLRLPTVCCTDVRAAANGLVRAAVAVRWAAVPDKDLDHLVPTQNTLLTGSQRSDA